MAAVLGLSANVGECSLESACCERNYVEILAQPSCAAKVAAGGAAAVYGVPVALGLLGFGPLGPIAGSIAAIGQSLGAGGVIFSFLQSLGMTGLGPGGAATGASVAYSLCCAGVSCSVR